MSRFLNPTDGVTVVFGIRATIMFALFMLYGFFAL
jgi:hypothetical protein